MTSPKPLAGHRLLITNDDGVDAPGILLLEEIAHQLSNDVWVIAPDSEKSGAGHSISLHNPIRLRRRSERRNRDADEGAHVGQLKRICRAR